LFAELAKAKAEAKKVQEQTPAGQALKGVQERLKQNNEIGELLEVFVEKKTQPKEVVKEVPVEIIKEVIKEVPVEVVKEVPIEIKGKTQVITKEVIKEVKAAQFSKELIKYEQRNLEQVSKTEAQFKQEQLKEK
jgi:hypothetical protein